MPAGGVSTGRLMSFWSPDVRLTFVLTAGVAAALAVAVDAPGIEGGHIDLGWDLGRFNRLLADLGAMMRYFQTGHSVADPRRQSEVFGPVPAAEKSVGRLLRDAGLTPEPAG